MSGRPVPSQLDQVLPRFYVQKPGPYHPFGRIRIAPFGKGGLRILAEWLLEEVLLSPALEHAVGDFDVAQVPSTGDHLRLMAAVAQARHLP